MHHRNISKKTLDAVENALKTEDITELDECIRALNAHVAQSARDNDTDDNPTQFGANKFFLNGGNQDIGGLYAVRGYYSSIRPAVEGVLLNVNIPTSFLPPDTISTFLGTVSKFPESSSSA